jgi:putative aldouronate transport system substrate-binding protein
MYKFKKGLGLLVAAAMLLSLAATGCGSAKTGGGDTAAAVQSADQTQDSAAASTPAASAAQQLEPVELSWYYLGNTPGEGQAKVETALGDYLKDKINATVRFYPLGWDEFHTKTGAMTAANEPYDITFSPAWIGFADAAAKNSYLDITELFPKYCPETKKLLGDDFLKGGYYNGKLLAIPTNKEKAHSIGLMVNKQLLDKYSLDLNSISTINDLEPMLKTIKDNEPDVIPFMVNSGANIPFLIPQLDYVTGDDTYGVAAKYGDTKLLCPTETAEMADAYKLTRDWYLKGYVYKDAATEAAGGDTKKSQTLENDGKVFAYVANLIPQQAANRSNEKVTWVQKQLIKPRISAKDLGGSMNSISSTSKNPERALMFLELVNTDKTVNNLIAWGIEGTNYTKVSENGIRQDDKSDYVHTNQWIFGNQFLNYLKDTESPTKWEEFLAFNEEAVPDKSLGFVFTKTDDVKTEIAAVRLAYSKTYLWTGCQDVDKELPKLIDQLKKAGVDKIISTVQTEYDVWLASQK